VSSVKGGSPSAGPTPTSNPKSTPTPTPAPTPTPTPIPVNSICGTWPLLTVTSSNALNWFSTLINQSLSVPGVAGFSIRAPWTSITSDLSIYSSALAIAQAHHVGLAIRFVSGVATPSQFMGNSTLMQGQPIPLPWGAGSTPTSFVPNTAFEAGYTATVRQLAAWARGHGVHMLHLPWYSGPSAEVYLGPEIQSAPGYSLQNFLTGYQRLLDIGMSVAGSDLHIEFPLGGVNAGPADGPIQSYALSKYGSAASNLLFQWNNLTDTSPSVRSAGVSVGRQMLLPIDYNWDAVYRTVATEDSEVVEVYIQSFAPSLPHAAQLRQNIAAFATSC
jgi:hypothetical protein